MLKIQPSYGYDQKAKYILLISAYVTKFDLFFQENTVNLLTFQKLFLPCMESLQYESLHISKIANLSFHTSQSEWEEHNLKRGNLKWKKKNSGVVFWADFRCSILTCSIFHSNSVHGQTMYRNATTRKHYLGLQRRCLTLFLWMQHYSIIIILLSITRCSSDGETKLLALEMRPLFLCIFANLACV